MSRAVVLTDIEYLGNPRERDLFYIGAIGTRCG
jgi:hypothetical protein